jgi:DNA-binding NarL/FixJ family response regulator
MVPVSVVIVDDNEGTRSLLRVLARRDERFEIVGEASDGLEAVVIIQDRQPDAVILDIMMPIATGLDAIPDILEVSPRTRIIGYSAFVGYRDEAFALGAHGWCTKGASWEVLADTIVASVEELRGTGERAHEEPSGSQASSELTP